MIKKLNEEKTRISKAQARYKYDHGVPIRLAPQGGKTLGDSVLVSIRKNGDFDDVVAKYQDEFGTPVLFYATDENKNERMSMSEMASKIMDRYTDSDEGKEEVLAVLKRFGFRTDFQVGEEEDEDEESSELFNYLRDDLDSWEDLAKVYSAIFEKWRKNLKEDIVPLSKIALEPRNIKNAIQGILDGGYRLEDTILKDAEVDSCIDVNGDPSFTVYTRGRTFIVMVTSSSED